MHFTFDSWLSVVCALAVLSIGCSKNNSTKTEGTAKPPSVANAPHVDSDGHGGPVIELGTATIGGFSAKATRDQGEIVAGKDAPIDVTVTPVSGTTEKVSAVRFWIGTEDGSGSVKAKAEVENPDEPDRWHTHAEIPSEIPAGAKLWVEVEDDKGGKYVGSFDLKM